MVQTELFDILHTIFFKIMFIHKYIYTRVCVLGARERVKSQNVWKIRHWQYYIYIRIVRCTLYTEFESRT